MSAPVDRSPASAEERRAHDALALLAFSLESDYGPRAPTRWSQPWSPWSVRLSTAVAALIVGFLLTSGLVVGHRGATEQNQRKSQLVELVHQRQERAAALAVELETLRGRVREVQQSVEGVTALTLQRDIDRLSAATGLTPMAGPGLRVTLSDAKGTCVSGRPEDCRIQDTDLQLALNELWAAGAEAIAINGERVISTTAVRNAGAAVLVNYHVLTSPYTVDAIGDPELLRDGFLSSQLASDFGAWQQTFGLGFSVQPVAEIVVPPYAGAVRLDAGITVDRRRGQGDRS